MSITRVQYAKSGSGAAGLSLSVTWGQATAAGNSLFLLLAFSGSPGTVTPPSGYSQIGSTLTSGNTVLMLFAALDASSQSGGQLTSWQNSVGVAAFLIEYAGITTNAPQDGSNKTNTGSSTSPSTGALSTSYASELLLAAIAETATSTMSFSLATGGFSLVDQQSSTGGVNNHLQLGFLEQIVSAINSYTAGCTSSVSSSWAGLLSGWEASPANLRIPKVLVSAPQPPSSSFD